MKTLICSSQTPRHLSNPPPWKPRSPFLHPTTLLNLEHPIKSTLKQRANAAKGFTGKPPTALKETSTRTEKSNKTNNDDDDEVPQVVYYRMITRILTFVGVPMAVGLALLHIFGVIKEQQMWDVPLWLPFTTTFLTFGASTMGIAYGALSTSWDPERKGSVFGFEEVQKNWVEVWKEEDMRA